MIESEPSVKEMAALWKTCMRFIMTKDIHCAETVYQSDRVIEGATTFIEEVCEIVGYNDVEEDDV